MTRRIDVKSAFAVVACALVFGGAALAQGTGWATMAAPPKPAIRYNAGAAGEIIIMCDDDGGRHTYSMGVYGPASGAQPADRVKAAATGAKRVTLYVKAKVHANGRAAFTASNSLNRYGDNKAEVYDVLASLLKARGDITFSSGEFKLAVPSAGFKAAMAPLVKTCGDPGKLAKQVRARSEPA